MPELKNYMEVCVKDTLADLIKSFDCCDCEDCRYDMMAIALNSLPPKYVVTNKGTLFTKISMLQNQFDTDVIAALTNAIKIVSSKPRHDTPKI